MRRKPKPDRSDAESPELSAEWFARARPGREVMPGLIGPANAEQLLRSRRVRPPLATPKEHVNVRLDADILLAFKSEGRGWQTRLNAALRDWLRLHRP